MRNQKAGLWSAMSGSPPVFVGLAGVVILAFEGRILDTFLVLLLIAIHHVATRLLSRPFRSSDQIADWTAVRVLTTLCCLGLPFYLALTI